jgi:alcohol dehydrogenase
VLLATTGSLVNTREGQKDGPLQRVQGLVGNRLAGTFTSVRQHSPASVVDQLVLEAERLRTDLFISLGGGSVIDAVKAAALALARDEGSFLPHIALPTTLSAAEFSPFFGVTDDRTRVKSGASNPFLAPQVVFLDVELTALTPDWLWYASGIRALDHAVETVYAPDHQPATDAPALEAIRLLFRQLPVSGGDNRSVAARQQCQLAAWLSFFGVANISLGLSHALGRQLGPRYGIPHGYTSAVLLPHVMETLLPVSRDRQELILQAAQEGSGRPYPSASEAVARLVETLGLPRRLRDVEVPKQDLAGLAAGRPDILQILEAAW